MAVRSPRSPSAETRASLMGRRAGLTLEQVVDAAEAIADSAGAQAVTLAAVAERLEVRSPSLYHHLGGLSDLRRRLALRASERLTEALGRATEGRSGAEAVRSVAAAYRDFARSHPGLHDALSSASGPGDPELGRALATPWDVVARAVGEGRAARVVPLLRSFLFGYTDLERRGMPGAGERSFRDAVELIAAAAE